MTGLGRRGRPDDGQSTVELALLLPVVAVVLLVVLQLLAVIRDQTAVGAAARAAARRAVVSADAGDVRAAAVSETRLHAERLTVTMAGDVTPGGYVTVTVRYRSPTDVPVVGRFIPDVVVAERLVARRE